VQLRILRIHPFYPSSAYAIKRGTMRFDQDKRIAERGHKVYVISCKTFGAPFFERLKGIEIFRVPALVIPVIEYPLPNLILFYSWVAELIKRNKIDVVHVEDGAYLTSLLVVLVKKVLKKPVILSMQGFPGISWFYGNSFIDWVGKIYAFTIGKLVLKTADNVILSATAFVEDARRLGAPLNRIAVIPRGVDIQVYCPNPKRRKTLREKLDVKEDETMVLFAGRLVPVKGLNYFVDMAMSLLRENKKLKFIVAGEGILRGKYQKASSAFKSNIRFIGYRNDMYDVMNAADIFVLSSISEGCPNAVIEAGACAKPVVATCVGAAPDIVFDGETGILVKPRSAKSLSDGLNKILALQDASEMGKKALKRIRNAFSLDSIALRWERVYMETLNSASSARTRENNTMASD